MRDTQSALAVNKLLRASGCGYVMREHDGRCRVCNFGPGTYKSPMPYEGATWGDVLTDMQADIAKSGGLR